MYFVDVFAVSSIAGHSDGARSAPEERSLVRGLTRHSVEARVTLARVPQTAPLTFIFFLN